MTNITSALITLVCVIPAANEPCLVIGDGGISPAVFSCFQVESMEAVSPNIVVDPSYHAMHETLADSASNQKTGVAYYFDRKRNIFEGVRFTRHDPDKIDEFFEVWTGRMGPGASLEYDGDKFTISPGKPRELPSGAVLSSATLYGVSSEEFVAFGGTEFAHRLNLKSQGRSFHKAIRNNGSVFLDFRNISSGYRKSIFGVLSNQLGIRLQRLDSESVGDFETRQALGQLKSEVVRAVLEDLETASFELQSNDAEATLEIRVKAANNSPTQKFFASARTGMRAFQFADDSRVRGMVNLRLPKRLATNISRALAPNFEKEIVSGTVASVVADRVIHAEAVASENGDISWAAYAPENSLTSALLAGTSGVAIGTHSATWSGIRRFGIEWESHCVKCFPRFIVGQLGGRCPSCESGVF